MHLILPIIITIIIQSHQLCKIILLSASSIKYQTKHVYTVFIVARRICSNKLTHLLISHKMESETNILVENNEEVEVRIVNVESRRENLMNKNFQSMLKPLNLMQQLWFSTRCNIKDDVITKKSISSIVITFVGHAVFCSFSILKVYANKDVQNEKLSFALRYSMYFYSFIHIVGLCLNCMSIVYNSGNYVELITKINKVSRAIDDIPLIENVRKRNWVLLIVPIALTSILATIFSVFTNRNIGAVMTTFIILTFDSNILVAKGIINLLRMQLSFWITEVKTLTIRPVEDLLFGLKRIQILKSFLDMAAAFNLYKQTFQVMVKFSLMIPNITKIITMLLTTG